MKQKIIEALKTEFIQLGLSENTLGRLADYILGLDGVVKEEGDVATAVKRGDVALIAKSIQGEVDGIQKAKKKAEDDLADYKAKHPEKNDDDTKHDDDDDASLLDRIAAAVNAAVTPLTEKIAALENVNSAKAALEGARSSFFNGDYAKKYKDEANDAWEHAVEVNELTGNKMSAEELAEKATGYFNKAVSRKGVDTTKPFVAEPQHEDDEGTIDWSSEKKRLQEAGKLPKEQ